MDKQQKHTITQSGLNKLKAELKHLIEIKKEKLRDTVEDMRNKGDVTENEAYSLAIEDYHSNERQIIELKQTIKNAKVVPDKSTVDKISVGNTVIVRNNGKQTAFSIVGEPEADPMASKISSSSPIGRALIGHKKGDTVKVDLPKGVQEYEIVEID